MKMNWPFLLVAKGYKGHIGCEYLPRGQTEDGLQWLDEVMEWSLKSPKAKAEKSWQIEVAILMPLVDHCVSMGQPHMAKSLPRGKTYDSLENELWEPDSSWKVVTAAKVSWVTCGTRLTWPVWRGKTKDGRTDLRMGVWV